MAFMAKQNPASQFTGLIHSEELYNELTFEALNKGYLTLTRSEEHTSELQSRFDIVCRLLLEDKKYRLYICYSHLYITISYHSPVYLCYIHFFPTRRSSDLLVAKN